MPGKVNDSKLSVLSACQLGQKLWPIEYNGFPVVYTQCTAQRAGPGTIDCIVAPIHGSGCVGGIMYVTVSHSLLCLQCQSCQLISW